MPTFDRGSSHPTVLMIACVLGTLPLALTFALPDWYFASPNAIDPWLYNGFFRHLDLYASSLFPNTYYGTRLAWILPGHAAYSLLEAETAALVLHLTFYLAAVVALYYTIARITEKPVALGCAVAFGLFLPSARGLGDDYAAAGVVTYCIIGIALAVASTRVRSSWFPSLGSGVAAGAMFHSNIGAALLVPTILVWMIPAERSRAAFTSTVVRIAAWVTGAVLCTIGLGELSVQHGGTRWFFLRSFTWWQENNATNPWDQQGFDWVLRAPWVFLPVLTAVACGVALLHARRRAALDQMKVRALAAFAYIVGLFLIWDLFGSSAVLYWPFYSSWLMPASFIALGAVVLGTSQPGRFDAAACAVVYALLLVSLAEPDWIPLPFREAGLLIALAVGLAAGAVRRRSAAAVLLGVLVAHLNIWASVTGFFSPTEPRADVFRAVNETLDHIRPFGTDSQPRFLYDEKDPLFAPYYNATAGIYLWAYSTVTRTYPDIDTQGARTLPPGSVATVLASEAQTLAEIEQALAPYALHAELMHTRSVRTAFGPYYVTFFRILEPEQ